MKRRIEKISYSIQGEGLHAGTAMTYLRFSSCRLACPDCEYDLSDDEVLGQIERIGKKSPFVSLVGDEPATHIDVDFLNALHAAGKQVCIETSGIVPLDGLPIEFVSVKPSMRCHHQDIQIRKCSELIIPFDLKVNPDEWYYITANARFIRPIRLPDKEQNDAIMERAIEYVKENPNWKLTLPIHKILGLKQ